MRVIVDSARGLVHIGYGSVGSSFERGVFVPDETVQKSEPPQTDLRLVVPKVLVHQTAFLINLSFRLKRLFCTYFVHENFLLHPRFYSAFCCIFGLMSFGLGWAWWTPEAYTQRVPEEMTKFSPTPVLQMLEKEFAGRASYREAASKVFLFANRFEAQPLQLLALIPRLAETDVLDNRWIYSDADEVFAVINAGEKTYSQRVQASESVCEQKRRWWLLPARSKAVLVIGGEKGARELLLETTSGKNPPSCPAAEMSDAPFPHTMLPNEVLPERNTLVREPKAAEREL